MDLWKGAEGQEASPLFKTRRMQWTLSQTRHWDEDVGWAKARSDVPTVLLCARCPMVGTPPDAFASGCFAHPTRRQASSIANCRKTFGCVCRRLRDPTFW